MSKKSSKTKFKHLDISVNCMPTVRAGESWADIESEQEAADVDRDHIQKLRQNLPSAPKATRMEDDLSKVPTDGPFKAHVGNISFEACDEDLVQFFTPLSLLDINLATNQNKSRGFGTVEFSSREDLIEGLKKHEGMLKGRKIRIELPGTNDRGGGRGFDQGTGRRGEFGDREQQRPSGQADADNDWRRSAREVPAFNGRSNDRGGRFGGDRGGDRFGGDRGGDRFGSDRGGDRFGSDRGGDRFGGDRGGARFGGDRGGDRFGSDRGGRFGGDRGGDRYGGERGGGRFGGDRGDRYSDRGGDRYGGDRGGDRYGDSRGGDRNDGDRMVRRTEPAPRRDSDVKEEAPRERPRLQLAPRTQPIASEPRAAQSRQANIFGQAKPVDTLSKEMEIEKKMEREKEVVQTRPEPVSEDLQPSRSQRSVSTRSDSDSSAPRQRLTSTGSGTSSVRSPPIRSQPEEETTPHTSPQPRDAKPVEAKVVVPAPPPPVNVWEKRKQQMQQHQAPAPRGAAEPQLKASKPKAAEKAPKESLDAEEPTSEDKPTDPPSRAPQNAWAKGPPRATVSVTAATAANSEESGGRPSSGNARGAWRGGRGNYHGNRNGGSHRSGVAQVSATESL